MFLNHFLNVCIIFFINTTFPFLVFLVFLAAIGGFFIGEVYRGLLEKSLYTVTPSRARQEIRGFLLGF